MEALTPEVPEDIIPDILKRLPVKSLVRFRCVSKSWHSLITSSSFIHMHLHFNQSRSLIILARYCDTLLSVGPQQQHQPQPDFNITTTTAVDGFQEAVELGFFGLVRNLPYYVKGHCDGLICVVINDGGDGALVLWNPSIRQYKRLPLPRNFHSTREVFGLGFDSTIGDYKVVRAPSSYCQMKIKDYHPQVEVLTLGSNTWRKIPDEDTPPFCIEHFFQATNANGALYWIVAANDDPFRCEILRFDLAKEKFKVVPSPPDTFRRNVSWLGTLEGSLCAIHTQRLSYVDVWTSQDDETWTKLITIPRMPGPEASVRHSDYVPLCFTSSGAVVIGIKLEGFATYHPIENKVSKLAVHGVEHWLQETVCAESLVSPYAADEPAAARQHQMRSAHTTSRSLWQLILGGVANYFSCSSGDPRQ
nr:F-box protein CPR1-like [Quercus suber]POE58193.1 f-box protein cpr30 [Quercus suber]